MGTLACPSPRRAAAVNSPACTASSPSSATAACSSRRAAAATSAACTASSPFSATAACSSRRAAAATSAACTASSLHCCKLQLTRVRQYCLGRDLNNASEEMSDAVDSNDEETTGLIATQSLPDPSPPEPDDGCGCSRLNLP